MRVAIPSLGRSVNVSIVVYVTCISQSSTRYPRIVTIRRVKRPFGFSLIIARGDNCTTSINYCSYRSRVLPTIIVMIRCLRRTSQAVVVADVTKNSTRRLYATFHVFQRNMFKYAIIPMCVHCSLPIAKGLINSSKSSRVRVTIIIVVGNDNEDPIRKKRNDNLRNGANAAIVRVRPSIAATLSNSMRNVFVAIIIRISPSRSSISRPVNEGAAA